MSEVYTLPEWRVLQNKYVEICKEMGVSHYFPYDKNLWVRHRQAILRTIRESATEEGWGPIPDDFDVLPAMLDFLENNLELEDDEENTNKAPSFEAMMLQAAYKNSSVIDFVHEQVSKIQKSERILSIREQIQTAIDETSDADLKQIIGGWLSSPPDEVLELLANIKARWEKPHSTRLREESLKALRGVSPYTSGLGLRFEFNRAQRFV